MPWGYAVAAGIGLLGSSMQADAAGEAAASSAQAQRDAARISAEEARFRPVGITTAFGKSNFGTDAEGRLNSASYELTPQLAAARDRLLSQATGRGLDFADQGFAAGQGLFGLGQGYLAQTPQQAAQDWMASQQNLLAPMREQQLAGIRNNLFNTGRGGLAVGATGMRPDGSAGLAATNPEMAAYYNALAQQDRQLAAQAQEQGRAQTLFGTDLMNKGLGLFSTSYSPFQTQLGLAGTVEDLGMNALNTGAALGAKAQPGSSTAAQALLQGGLGAARTMQASDSYSPIGATLAGLSNNRQFTSGLGNWFNSRNLYNNSANALGFGQINPYSGEYMSSLEF